MEALFVKLSQRYSTPEKVQALLMKYKYNAQRPETMRSALGVWQAKSAHCLEATHFAAAILEHRGYPTLALSMESEDNIGHVVYLFQETGLWGSVGRSREPGLQGRRPVFKNVRDLAMSYFDEYVDDTGRLVGFKVIDLDDSACDWRYSAKNVWKSERYILNAKHHRLPAYEKRYQKALGTFLNTGHLSTKSWW